MPRHGAKLAHPQKLQASPRSVANLVYTFPSLLRERAVKRVERSVLTASGTPREFCCLNVLEMLHSSTSPGIQPSRAVRLLYAETRSSEKLTLASLDTSMSESPAACMGAGLLQFEVTWTVATMIKQTTEDIQPVWPRSCCRPASSQSRAWTRAIRKAATGPPIRSPRAPHRCSQTPGCTCQRRRTASRPR